SGMRARPPSATRLFTGWILKKESTGVSRSKCIVFQENPRNVGPICSGVMRSCQFGTVRLIVQLVQDVRSRLAVLLGLWRKYIIQRFPRQKWSRRSDEASGEVNS